MRAAWMAACLAALLNGCGGRPSAGPPSIRYGEDSCAQCRMLISEARFAAAVEPSGRTAAFDDIGCLLRYLRGHPDARTGRVWVHDAGSEEWLPAEAARFTRDPELATPMGSGLAAHRGAADGMTWDQLVSTWEAPHAK